MIITKKDFLLKILKIIKNKTIGLVPTMGYLHDGHLSLIEQSIKKSDYTIITIFVNPKQFNNNDDLINYPKDKNRDINLLKKYKYIIIYIPEYHDIYPNDYLERKYNFDYLDTIMEGFYRPGHFNGVSNVLYILFKLIKPHKAFFGEKDYQQCIIVKELVKKEQMDIEIIICPTIRDKRGLALSSRNSIIKPENIEETYKIYYILNYIKDSNILSIKKLKNIAVNFLKTSALRLEYIEILNEENLKLIELKTNKNKPRCFIAVYLENVRLIDNIKLY